MRLMQFTLRDVLIKQYDAETADTIFYEAGKKAENATKAKSDGCSPMIPCL